MPKMKMPSAAKKTWILSSDLPDLNRLRWGFSLKTIIRYRVIVRLGLRMIYGMVTGKKMVTMGRALMIRLKMAINDLDVPLWLETPLESLITENGSVTGVNVKQNGRSLRIKANKGVIIAAGGFEFNKVLRARHQPELPEDSISMGAESNTGDGILAGEAVGAATRLMDSAWWMPALVTSKYGPQALLSLRQAPRQFVINGVGDRFVNEACPYTEFGTVQLEGQKTGVSHIPAYVIMDNYTWTHNLIAGHTPGAPISEEWLKDKVFSVADSLEELADKIGVPADRLATTAARYNEFARSGRDLDFHCGENAYDNFYGDERLPNPNLGEVTQLPFYALKMKLSDLGTKGGLLTDANAQVLDQQGKGIPGLYAAGNSSASIMGYRYAGPGATIGAAMVYGWIAAHAMAKSKPDQ